MRTGVRHRAAACIGHHRQRCAKQHQRWGNQNRQRGHLHFRHVDFFTEVFRGAANHQPGDKYRQQDEQQHAVEARTHAAEDHFTNLHQPQRDHAAQRGKGVVHRVDRTAGGGGGHHGVQAAGQNAKAALFAFHIDAAVGSEGQQVRVTASFSPHHHRDADDENKRHSPQDGAALTVITHRFTKGKTQCGRDEENRQHLHKVGQRRRVLKRM